MRHVRQTLLIETRFPFIAKTGFLGGSKHCTGAVFSHFLMKIRVSFLRSCPGGVLGCLPGCFFETFGHPLGHFGTPLGVLWDTLGPLWATFWSPWGHVGTILAPRGCSWVPLEVNFVRILNIFVFWAPKLVPGIKNC